MKEQEYEGITAIIHNDFLDKPATNTIYYGQPEEFIKCPNCGELAKLAPEILTSLPPQRHWTCSHCHKDGYIYCHDAHIIYQDTPKEGWPWRPMDPMPNPEDLGVKKAVRCIICDEETEFYGNIKQPFICNKCKSAIKKLRRMLEEDN